MTLSLNAENRTHKPERLQLLAHHDVYDQPESGCTVQLGGVSVHLSGEDTIKLGHFLAGGHAALEALAAPATQADTPIMPGSDVRAAIDALGLTEKLEDTGLIKIEIYTHAVLVELGNGDDLAFQIDWS